MHDPRNVNAANRFSGIRCNQQWHRESDQSKPGSECNGEPDDILTVAKDQRMPDKRRDHNISDDGKQLQCAARPVVCRNPRFVLG